MISVTTSVPSDQWDAVTESWAPMLYFSSHGLFRITCSHQTMLLSYHVWWYGRLHMITPFTYRLFSLCRIIKDGSNLRYDALLLLGKKTGSYRFGRWSVCRFDMWDVVCWEVWTSFMPHRWYYRWDFLRRSNLCCSCRELLQESMSRRRCFKYVTSIFSMQASDHIYGCHLF